MDFISTITRQNRGLFSTSITKVEMSTPDTAFVGSLQEIQMVQLALYCRLPVRSPWSLFLARFLANGKGVVARRPSLCLCSCCS